ncbi:Na+/H+ antiporter NhaC [Lentilactobacillus senioris]|uniref:Na+/H+ antiporter NhaC n=1 Tax=Lentilactobacillus senioris TaxID=931534 RepID=UPI00228130EA|nr:Na+/H+ antiporter NhaC [Lentilactobacillus senioris]MCY9806317.1 Na+/H+ antiporter NhaC [Lentilactobacillus senioris]
MKQEQVKIQVSLTEGILILLGMMLILGLGVIKFQLSPEVPILVVIGLLMLWARVRHFNWDRINQGLVEGVSTGIIPIFIFILIGALISTWIMSGVIPSLMVFGFQLITARWFLPSVFLVCAIVGSAIGSALTVISTVGIAFLGMGITMGINPAMIAGAIISGAVFGDKTSPLSDSTNLAAAIVGADLFSHIKNLMWSTIPAFFVALIGYMLIGPTGSQFDSSAITKTVATLNQHFFISPWALLPIVLMFVCAWIKIPSIPTLFINIAVAVGMIFMTQPHTSLAKIVDVIVNGFVAKTGNANVDTLLSRGGILAMMSTVSLVIMALGLGGMLMNLGIIEAVMIPVSKRLKSPSALVTATILSGIGVNLFVGEQYLASILPGNAFKETYKRAGLAPVALSRVLEDGGTVINYLVPWGVAAVFTANALGIPTLQYLPFVFFSLASPIFSLLSAYTGIGLKHLKPSAKGVQKPAGN